MSKETITVLSILGVGFVVTLVGGISWALKKKVGLFVALIGVAILFSAFLFIPKSEDTPESPIAPAKTIMISEIKADYDANTLSADDIYKGNRYRITGTIETIGDGGLNGALGNLSVAVVVTEEGHRYNLWCTFNEETQRDKLKKFTMGETITFEGTCESWGNWHDCEVVE